MSIRIDRLSGSEGRFVFNSVCVHSPEVEGVLKRDFNSEVGVVRLFLGEGGAG